MSLSYGPLHQQVVDLWQPDGEGPHPVVLMVHGGCWQKAIADRTLMNYAAEDLRQRGLAVWNIEYRGVDEEGGGYPGTYLDVTAATEALFERGGEVGLDTSRVAGIGHSAGGHLVTWLAARGQLPTESAVYGEGQTFEFRSVVNSGGLADLEASSSVTLDTCLAAIESQLTGEATPERPDVYADTSSSRLQPAPSEQISVNGQYDRIAPFVLGEGFTTQVIAAGGSARFVEVADTGHVELIAPGTDAWSVQAALLEEALAD
tara:strand:- start:1901 stop:2683 length:783 start_codon:yes stop_codon:yes gene_type:complete